MLGNPESIKIRGWRQGSILPDDLVDKLHADQALDEKHTKADAVLIVSQDCDLVNRSYDAEPYAEVLLFSKVPKVDGNLTYGKNPRKLQVSAVWEEMCFETSIHSRQSIARCMLEDYSPAPISWNTDPTVEIIRRWISRRYTRVALPDAFNQRCKPVLPGVEKKLRASGRDFSGIYIRLSTYEELEDSADYEVLLVGTMRIAVKDDTEKLLVLYEAMDEIEELLNLCNGICVVESSVIGEDEYTLDNLKDSQRWNWDHLSLREDDGGEIAPED